MMHAVLTPKLAKQVLDPDAAGEGVMAFKQAKLELSESLKSLMRLRGGGPDLDSEMAMTEHADLFEAFTASDHDEASEILKGRAALQPPLAMTPSNDRASAVSGDRPLTRLLRATNEAVHQVSGQASFQEPELSELGDEFEAQTEEEVEADFDDADDGI